MQDALFADMQLDVCVLCLGSLVCALGASRTHLLVCALKS